MVQAPENLEQLNLTRMEELEAAAKASSVTGWNKQWFECALELYRLNNTKLAVLSDALYNSLSYCCGKFRNVILVSPTNAGKTLMIKLLNVFFKIPLTTNSDRVGLQGECDVIRRL